MRRTIALRFGRTTPLPRPKRPDDQKYEVSSFPVRIHTAEWKSKARIDLEVPPLVDISNATFYKRHPTSHGHDVVDRGDNPPLFPNLTFSIPSFPRYYHNWAVIGPSSLSRTTFLQIIQGQHLTLPPNARRYPYLATEEISQKDPRLRYHGNAIQHIGFDAERSSVGTTSIRGAYLSARYESHREATDFSVLDYLRGNTELNPMEDKEDHAQDGLLYRIVDDLMLRQLLELPVANLSNGQTRRARIAKALMAKPELLLIDGPFMGLDPPSRTSISKLLHLLTSTHSPRLVLSLKPQDLVPMWITHLVYVDDDCRVLHMGEKETVISSLRKDFLDLVQEGPSALEKDPKSLALLNAAHVLFAPGSQFALDLTTLSESAIKKYEYGLKRFEKGAQYPTNLRNMRRLPETPWQDQKNQASLRGKLSYAADSEGALMMNKLTPEDREKYDNAVLKIKDGINGRKELENVGINSGHYNYSSDGYTCFDIEPTPQGEPLIEMQGVKIGYGKRQILGAWKQKVDEQDKQGLWWTIRRGERWGVFGPNGSGKTTLLSLMTSDHPQTYSQPIRLFGRSRLPKPGQPGISLFDIQKRIGHSSPEVHTFFPKQLSVRRTLESAWADAPLSKPALTHERDMLVDAFLRWFRVELGPNLQPYEHQLQEWLQYDWTSSEVLGPEGHKAGRLGSYLHDQELDFGDLDWADRMLFGELSFSSQRLALFLRAIIASPDLIILDEAFSNMDERTRAKCMAFLGHGETLAIKYVQTMGGIRTHNTGLNRSTLDIAGKVTFRGLSDQQALVVVSHVKEDIPGSVRNWIRLPEPGMGAPEFGKAPGPIDWGHRRWNQIWGEEDFQTQFLYS